MYFYFLLLLIPAWSQGHRGHTISKCGTLPSSWYPLALHNTAVLYDGNDSIYLFGGGNGNIYHEKDLLKYSTVSHKFETIGEFPIGVEGGHATYDSTGEILYFSGDYKEQTGNPIYKIVLSLDDLVADFTYHHLGIRHIPAYANTGELLYLIGGHYYEQSTIAVYNLTSNRGRILSEIPLLYGAAAVYAGGDIFVFGGFHKDQKETNQIWKYNPSTNVTQILDVVLPNPVSYTSAVMVGSVAYILPGRKNEDKIILFDTEDYSLSEIDLVGYSRISPTAAYVQKQNRIYVFGMSLTDHKTMDVVCIDLPPKFECIGQEDGLYPHPNDCTKYISCVNEAEYVRDCPSGLHFNPKINACDYPENANCEI